MSNTWPNGHATSQRVKVLGPNNEVWAEAPTNAWLLRDKPWPAVGELVEVCWSSRKKVPPVYVYGKAKLITLPREDGGSAWANEAGQDLVFNPDFWRPLK